MWSGGDDDYNDDGEAVRLYQPILYGRKASQDDLSCSFVGGQSTAATAAAANDHDNQPLVCGSCQEPLHLLLQLFVPGSSCRKNDNGDDEHEHERAPPPLADRTLQVYACNRAACVNALFSNDDATKTKLAPGDSVVVCQRRAPPNTGASNDQMDSEQQPPPSNTWAQEEGQVDAAKPSEAENEWAMDEGGDAMDSLEAKLAAMESSTSTTSTPAEASSSSSKNTSARKPGSSTAQKPASSNTKNNQFPCYLLHAVQEPSAARPMSDEDDVGIAGPDDKIQQMLARYMAEEEDEDILSALQADAAVSSGGGGVAEKDERLSPADRALLTFSDRMKRSPRQVVRYAYNGVPLWSIPVESQQQQARYAKQRAKAAAKKTGNTSQHQVAPSIPPCPCGAARVFEMQLVPPLLHVLQVDKVAAAAAAGDGTSAAKDASSIGAAYEHGGMNWGNIAIYSCPRLCTESANREYVLVQKSVDEEPAAEPRLNMMQGDVLIDENAIFDEDEDDDDDDDNGEE